MVKTKLHSAYHAVKALFDDKKKQKIFLGMEILLCILIFIPLSGGKGVDWDEAFTHQLVRNNDILGIIRGTAIDVHPPLYYLIVKFFTTVFGYELVVYTWASITAAIGCMILNSTLIYKRFGFWTAGLLNIAFSFAPTILFYNFNIRMYSWTLFFCLGCLLFSCETMETGSAFQWCMLFLFSIMGVYTQYFAVFPIVAAYAVLMLYIILHKQWQKFISFTIVCILNIISFIPWLRYASHQFQTSGIQQEYVEGFQYIPTGFFGFASSSNLLNVNVMLMILFFVSFFIFVLKRKEFSQTQQWFIGMLYFCVVFCYYGAQILAIFGNHFFSWRYIYPATGIIWILYCIVFPKLGIKVYIPFTIFSLILCLYSYSHVYDWEYNTTPLLEKTIAFTDANIEDGCVIVYDYGNFDTLYSVYLPNHEFIYFDNLDLSSMKGETFWFIQLGGSYFTEDMQDTYGLEIEHYSDFGYMGMVKFELEKVTVTQ